MTRTHIFKGGFVCYTSALIVLLLGFTQSAIASFGITYDSFIPYNKERSEALLYTEPIWGKSPVYSNIIEVASDKVCSCSRSQVDDLSNNYLNMRDRR